MSEREFIIHVNTSPPHSIGGWIKLRRNNQYIPYNRQCIKPPVDPNGWQLVQTRRQSKKGKSGVDPPIYYWSVIDHNLFDTDDSSMHLYFTDIDTLQIENIDQNNYMAIDKNRQLCLIHVHLKHKGMKMTPTYYIARSVDQITEALHFVKYCVVQTVNNEQKLVGGGGASLPHSPLLPGGAHLPNSPPSSGGTSYGGTSSPHSPLTPEGGTGSVVLPPEPTICVSKS